MIIFLSELQKDHLNLVIKQSPQVLVDFCKLAIDYLSNGINHAKYSTAANKFDTSITNIQNLVHAIVFLLVEGSKHNLSDCDFKSSLAIAGFPAEHQEVLIKLYNTKKSEISECLHVLQQADLVYQDLTWRMEVEVASRFNNETVKPNISMDFVLMKPKKIVPESALNCVDFNSTKKETSIMELDINKSVEEATAASQCQNVISHILLQCDLPNLLHLTNQLDQALKESKSQHVRKVKSALN
ncbi:uncharacterized protein LOC105388323 [Plutella xylostella]|uniref:uncharacterized protein LOC105388323 n=1 Tax=Plutella xylostella TaxID=51655 RepID=UPI00203271E7|nr:uncharacterized protein LOC105388323 [Plutella xylostella]